MNEEVNTYIKEISDYNNTQRGKKEEVITMLLSVVWMSL